jgi:protein-S-isoprenylcysteine O-methyltransferase Ste14
MAAPDTAGVVAPPPLIFATAFVAGWLLGRVFPWPILPAAIAFPAGFVPGIAGLALAVAAFREMRRARTAVSPYAPTTALVRTGPFAHSRNPLYVALTLLSLGLALAVNTMWCVLLLLPALVVLRRGVVAREEAYLRRCFGEAYRAYCATTRRWL